MTLLKCPHCGKDVDLVGQREITDEYGLGPNPVAHLRQQGAFPEPVLEFGNRNMWLREQIEDFTEQRSRARIAKMVEEFQNTLHALPETEQERAVSMLLDDSKPRRRR